MRWIEFAVYTTDAGLDMVCGALSTAGVEQFSIEESSERVSAFLQHTAPYWDFADAVALAAQNGPCVKAYIADIPENQPLLVSARAAIERLRGIPADIDIGPLTVRESGMDEEDWANNWKRYYKPAPIGERLLICPSWEAGTLTPALTHGRTVVLMDPGMVFGTGAHHTTRMCLEALGRRVRTGDTILDLGCGSGILAIAALLLGARNALCVDIDPVAERVVRDNIDMNGIDPARCSIRVGNILADTALQNSIGTGYDIVAANIVADVIIALCPLVKNFVKQQGLFLCSGIIDERAEEVRAALISAGFTVLEKLRSAEEAPEDSFQQSGWVAFLTRRL